MITIISLNSDGLLTNEVYIQHLITTYKPDVICIQEHWLYNFEKHKINILFKDYNNYTKCVDDNDPITPKQRPRGYGGVSILWKKEIDEVQKMPDGSARTVVVKIRNLAIVNTYLPCKGKYTNQEFMDEMSQVREICMKCQDGPLILTGDINVDLTKNQDYRVKHLQELMEALNLKEPDDIVSPTFYHYNGVDTSKIDYIMLNQLARENMSYMNYDVIDRESSNTSPHQPLMLKACSNLLTKSYKLNSTFHKADIIFWDKCDIQLYQDTLEHFLCVENNLESAELAVEYFTHALKQAEMVAVPRRKRRNKFVYKLWNEDIKQLYKDSKEVDWEWKNAGKPDKPHPLHNERTKIRKQLRTAQRIQNAVEREQNMRNIMSANVNDKALFYKLIHQQRKTACDDRTQELKVDNDTYHDDILSGWTLHFSKLAQPTVNLKYDIEFQEQAKRDVSNIQHLISSTPSLPHIPLTKYEVKLAVNQLKKKKAVDGMNIVTEHLQLGGDAVINFMTHLFNKIIEDQHIPASLKTGILHPIHKKGKPINEAGCYRGITICSLIGKVFDIICTKHQKEAVDENANDLQFGFTKHKSPSHATMLLTELLVEAKEKKIPIYIANIDIQKAFDVVPHDSLLRKLHMQGLHGRWWKLKHDAYQDMSTSVTWQGNQGAPFPIRQGTRQGGISSTSDFKSHLRDLLCSLETSSAGCSVGSIPSGFIAVADDMILLADDLEQLRGQLNLFGFFANRECFDINVMKSSVIVRGIPHDDFEYIKEEQPWSMNEEKLRVENDFTHLGINYNFETNSYVKQIVMKKLELGRITMYSLMGAGLHGTNGLNPTISYQLYQVYILPRITYSLESLNLSEADFKMLETSHRSFMKSILSLATRAANASVYILLGTLPLEALIDRNRLNALLSMVLNPTLKIIMCRQIAMKKMTSDSWVIKTQKLLRKYHLKSLIDIILEPPVKKEWKNEVNTAVTNLWKKNIVEEAATKSTLIYLNPVLNVKAPHRILTTCSSDPRDIRRAHVKTKLITGTYTLQYNRVVFNQTTDACCPLCHKDDETREHFLLKCEILSDIRKPHMEDIINTIPYIYVM
jgi:endonuclease/exonuclease/phosphatase family metal-dependent hydrolase